MLTVTGLTRVFANSFDAMAGGVREATFTLPAGAFFTLLGPSGCGKTTTLRCLAGLERPDHGRIELEGRVLFDGASGTLVPVHQRGIGMVFQSYAIWPHMTVFENIAFPLLVARARRYGRAEITRMVDQALATVGLAGYGPRPATRLSGGQQQRVALARAIVHQPKLLLLDEPLSNLDASLREEMRTELRRLQQQIGITTVYVTHDQSEALAMSDQIAVMQRGRIVQLDAPRAIYFTPANDFVASFIGAANLLAGTAAAAIPPGGTGPVRLADGSVILCACPAGTEAGQPATVALRPESITVAAAGGPAEAGMNVLAGRLAEANFLGATLRCDVEAAGQMLHAVATPDSVLALGAAVHLAFAPEAAVVVRTAD
ncbi:MAG TPA: ABC transporter ATP-binding protein [Acetobacteraceae bacterium]|nr:ABC transporter ATP-binding protein [Acetobacteraceae bacterium]